MILSTKPDSHWKHWGSCDPYYAVLSSDEYKGSALDEAARQRFFQTGEEQVNSAFEIVRAHLAQDFAPERCLDFGCGVGRTLIPLARRCREAVGVDISPAMLAEAARNCSQAGVNNIALVESDPLLSKVQGNYDFVYSIIVFHHIRTNLGYQFLEALLQRLNARGVIALQFLYALHSPKPVVALRWAQARVPMLHAAVNVVRRRPISTPNMEGNVYNLGKLFEILERNGLRTTVSRITRHPVGSYVMLYARKD